MSNGIDDLLLGGGAAGKGMKFEHVGAQYAGTVVSVEVRAYTDLKTGKPEFWEDGNAKQQLVIGIQTDERAPEVQDDDGVRYDYVKMWGKQKQGLRIAAQAAGGSPAAGDHYGVKFVGTEPSKTRGFNDTKLYEYTIRKANPADAALNAGFPATVPAAAPSTVGLGAAVPAAPVAQAVATVPAALDAQQLAQVGMLLGQGLSAEQIAGVLTFIDAQGVEAIRAQQGALVGAGF